MAVCKRKRPIAMCAIFRHKAGDNPKGKIRGVIKLGRKKAIIVGLMAMQGKSFCIKAGGCFIKTKKRNKCGRR